MKTDSQEKDSLELKSIINSNYIDENKVNRALFLIKEGADVNTTNSGDENLGTILARRNICKEKILDFVKLGGEIVSRLERKRMAPYFLTREIIVRPKNIDILVELKNIKNFQFPPTLYDEISLRTGIYSDVAVYIRDWTPDSFHPFLGHFLKQNPTDYKHALQLIRLRGPSRYDSCKSLLHDLVAGDFKENAKYIRELISIDIKCISYEAEIHLPNIGYTTVTALAYAINVNKFDTALLLVELGADPNTCDRLGTPLLHCLIRQKKFEAMQRLLQDPRLNIQAKDQKEQTALSYLLKEHYSRSLVLNLIRSEDKEHQGEVAFTVANNLVNGKNCKKNMADAVVFYQYAADQKHLPACFELACCYQYGRLGVPQDLSKAMNTTK